MTPLTTKHPLFQSYEINGIPLSNRFVMAPVARSRASQPGDIPTALNAEYYAQRASAGLIITEATQVSLQGKGYANTPGIYTPEQIAGWKLVTDAVHDAGSSIFLQLSHAGRVGSAKVNGLQPIAPSAQAAKDTKVYIFEDGGKGSTTMIPTDEPREMTQEDIDQVIKEFRQGAANAIAAGFDGVEINGGNGFLIDQFLHSNSNQRTDQYGETQRNRVRFLMEVTKAVIDEVGPSRTGVLLSPFITAKDMADPDILETVMLAVQLLNEQGVAYLHICEADGEDVPEIPEMFELGLRSVFRNTIIVSGNYTPDRAKDILKTKYVDLVGFGRNYIANPDYPSRVALGAALNKLSDAQTLLGGDGAKGYTDYPVLGSK